MLSVLITADENEEGLARTLASLVPAVVAGVLRDAAVIDPDDRPAIASIADAAGCRRITGPVGEAAPAALAGLQGGWVLVILPGTVLEEGWFREAAEFIERAQATGRADRHCAAFAFASQDYGTGARLTEAWRFVAGSLFGSVIPAQGLILTRRALQERARRDRLPPRPGGRVVVLRARAFAP